jgi:hypothetical protein
MKGGFIRFRNRLDYPSRHRRNSSNLSLHRRIRAIGYASNEEQRILEETKGELKTNNPQVRFKMLIGDDCYNDNRNAEDHLLLMLVEMKKYLGIKGPLSDKDIENGFYSTDQFPVQSFSGADIRVVDSVEAMIKEGNSCEYNWIVSDMDYGNGRVEGGLEVFRRITPKQGIIRAIFTSGDDKKKLERMSQEATTKLAVDYFIAPALSQDETEKLLHKTDLLGRTIARHYEHMKGGLKI